MNYTSPHQAESSHSHSIVRQSDEIMKKLYQIKNAIDSQQQTSPNNLNDYIPNGKFVSAQSKKPQKPKDDSNLHSYRQSLEKKLQRLFKEEKMGFNDSMTGTNTLNNMNFQISHNNFQNYTKINCKDEFTIQKMQYKIKQLERKYLHVQPRAEQLMNETNKKEKQQKQIAQKQGDVSATPNKKSKSLYEREHGKNENKSLISGEKQKIEDKSEKRLLTEINSLKQQLRLIKKSNYQLNEKIEHKQQERKNRKERSKYLLRCILNKLVQIQQQISRRDQKEENVEERRTKMEAPIVSPVEERQQLKNQNYLLVKQVKDLNKLLRKEINEREIVEERNKWIQEKIQKVTGM